MGQLLFGLEKKEVIKVIGEPDKKYKESFDNDELIEVWDYDKLGLSLSFDGKEVMELSSLSIISSFYEYNGVSLIGKSLEEVREVLKAVEYELVYYKSAKEKKILYSKQLSLVVLFDYDVATSISWDPSDIEVDFTRKLSKHLGKKQKRSVEKIVRLVHKVRKVPPSLAQIKKAEQRVSNIGANIASFLLIALFGGFALVSLIFDGYDPFLLWPGGIALIYILCVIYFNFFHEGD